MTDTETFAIDAERALLGALLLDRDAIADVVERLTAEAFHSPQFRAIYAAICECWQRRVPPDLLTVRGVLLRGGKSDDEINTADIVAMMADAPYAVHARYYADLVVEQARSRAMTDAAADLARLAAKEPNADIDEALQQARAKLDHFGAVAYQGPVDYADAVPDFQADILAEWAGERARTEIPTGIRQLDMTLSGGFRPGELIVLGARPGMGKTSLLLQLAHNAARARRDKRVLIFSAEMSLDALLLRAASEVSRISYLKAKSGELTTERRDKFLAATATMERLPVAIDETSAITVGQMQVRIERAQLHGPISLVLFDYLELAGDQIRGDSEERRVGEVIRRLKHVAKVCRVPLVVLSQLSRDVERRGNGNVPKLADLRYSGAIEANADVVLMLYRYDYYVQQRVLEADQKRRGLAEIIVAKQRNGPTPTITVRFNEETMTFSDLDQEY